MLRLTPIPDSFDADVPIASPNDSDDGKLATGGRPQKLGERVARRILSDIVARGWNAGEVLGTERELLIRYGISRATFREAVRQVERHGAAMMRRGAGGGLVVSAPARGAVVRAMTTFFELTRVSFAEQHEVREQLERAAVRLASERITPGAEAELLSALETLHGDTEFAETIAANMNVRVAIAQSTNNPSLPLFIETLNGVIRDILEFLRIDRSSFIRDRELSKQFKQDLITAIIRRDAGEAERLVVQDAQRRLLAMASLITSPVTQRDMADHLEEGFAWRCSDKNGLKLSERVAFSIVDDIERAGWEEGHNLGNEAALQKRYSVSRAVLREAIRQVELHGIARVKSGVRGGLIIGAVDSGYTEEVVGTYLDSTNVSPSHLWETQSVLEIFAVERLAALATPADCEALRQALRAMSEAPVSVFLECASVLHAEIANRTGNRALGLFVRILLRYGLKALPPVVEARLPWLVAAHGRMVEAICEHDAGTARREMAIMFDKSRVWVGLQRVEPRQAE